jgi:hypothetical protein
MNGFTGTVSVTLSGLGAGATNQPAGPFTIADGATESFVIDVPESSPAGISSVRATGTSASISHSAQIALAVNPLVMPAVTTFDDGTSFVLQTQTATGSHGILVQATDNNGNVATYATQQVDDKQLIVD